MDSLDRAFNWFLWMAGSAMLILALAVGYGIVSGKLTESHPQVQIEMHNPQLVEK